MILILKWRSPEPFNTVIKPRRDHLQLDKLLLNLAQSDVSFLKTKFCLISQIVPNSAHSISSKLFVLVASKRLPDLWWLRNWTELSKFSSNNFFENDTAIWRDAMEALSEHFNNTVHQATEMNIFKGPAEANEK